MSNTPNRRLPDDDDYVALNVAAWEKLIEAGTRKATDGRYIVMFEGRAISQHPDYGSAYDSAMKTHGERFLVQDLNEGSNIAYLGYRHYALV